jgi:hypothetical protein
VNQTDTTSILAVEAFYPGRHAGSAHIPKQLWSKVTLADGGEGDKTATGSVYRITFNVPVVYMAWYVMVIL